LANNLCIVKISKRVGNGSRRSSPRKHEGEPGDEDADVSAVLDHDDLVPRSVGVEVADSLEIALIQKLT
jgi:hypothetical protein